MCQGGVVQGGVAIGSQSLNIGFVLLTSDWQELWGRASCIVLPLYMLKFVDRRHICVLLVLLHLHYTGAANNTATYQSLVQ